MKFTVVQFIGNQLQLLVLVMQILTKRGTRRSDIFKDENNRKLYLDFIESGIKSNGNAEEKVVLASSSAKIIVCENTYFN